MLGKEEKDFTGLFHLIEYLENLVADLDVFQGELTTAAYGERCSSWPADHEHRTQILGRFSMHTLYTWDLHHARV